MMNFMWPTVTLLLFSLLVLPVNAANPSLVYQGRILKPNGDPLTASTVHFRIQIRSPGNENCLLYQETQDQDLSATSGIFSLTINGSASTRTDSSGISFQNIFSNRTAFSLGAGVCSSGTTYTPATTDGRKIAISFDDGTGVGWEPFPTQTLAYSAMAIESLQVGGYPASSLLRVANGSGPQTATALTPADFTELTALIAGTTTQYLKPTDNAAGFSGSLSGDITGAQGATVVSKIRGVSVSATAPTNGQALVYNGTSWAPATVAGSGSGTVTAVTSANSYLSVATGTSTPALTLNVGTSANTVAAGDDSRIVNALQPNTTIGGSTAINTSGNLVTSGTVSGATVSGTSIRAYNGANYVQLSAPALSGNVLFSLPSADGSSGQVLKTNGSGALSWYSLPSVVDWSVTGAELIHADRLSLGVGNASKAVVTSAAGAITASSATSTELGYLSGVTSAIQTQLNAKQATIDKTSTVPLSKVQIYGSNANNYVEVSAPAGLASNPSFKLPSADGASGQVLKTDGSGNLSWLTPASGTVTAVTSANSYLSVATGTSTPALTLNVGTSANTVAAGDDSRIVNALQPNTTIGGSTAINTSGDLVTTGTVSGATVSGTSIRAYNGANYVQLSAPALSGNVLFSLPSADGTSGQVLKTNGSGVLSWVSQPTVVDWSVTGAELIHIDRLSLGAGNASKAVVTSAAGAITASSATSTELGYLSGVTSAIQTQLDAKQATLSKTTVAPVSKIQIYGSNAANYVELTAPALSGNPSFTLPSADGTSGQVLKTDGAGNLSWVTPASGAVSSVNTQTGAVVLTSDNVSEGSTNKYYTDARAIAAPLTGLVTTTNAAYSATDTVLTALGKAQAQINARATLSGSTFTGNITAPAYFYSSDRRLKKNIETIDSALDKTLQLRGVTFDWRKNNEHEIGFIAQEVEEVVPVLVQTQNRGLASEMKSVKYGNIVALVVEALKEFYHQWFTAKQETDQKIVELEKKNAELEQKYLDLQKQIEDLKKNKNQ